MSDGAGGDSTPEGPAEVLSDELWEQYAERVISDEEAAEPWPSPPDYTVLRKGLLVAYLWVGAGALRRAGQEAKRLCDSPVVDVVCFSAKEAELLMGLLPGAQSLDALLFKLGIEDLRVSKGPTLLAPHLRQF